MVNTHDFLRNIQSNLATNFYTMMFMFFRSTNELKDLIKTTPLFMKEIDLVKEKSVLTSSRNNVFQE